MEKLKISFKDLDVEQIDARKVAIPYFEKINELISAHNKTVEAVKLIAGDDFDEVCKILNS